MYKLTSNLIIYKGAENADILFSLAEITRRIDGSDFSREDIVAQIYTQINKLLALATKYGFNSDLWHNYIAFLLATAENPFTLVSEKAGRLNGSVNELAKNDFKIFKALFDYDFSKIEQALSINCFSIICNYSAVNKSELIFNKSVSEKVQELSLAIEGATDENAVYEVVTDFYRRYGVGKLGLNKAFRISDTEEKGLLSPITATGSMTLDDLVGYDYQKAELIKNTDAFVNGKKANNVLLYGDAGTGKSTSIKAILNQYYSQGLRMIEIYKHEFKYLSQIINEIKNRNYRFIIYMDDLSFEEFEIEYKYLKAVIEGGLETKPENILIYATSNRRHLIRETWSDRTDISNDELHRSETMQEKLSLASRFGVTIGYFRPMKEEYLNIVTELAKKHPEITLSREELRAEASKWEINHGGMSGRTAQQFINSLLSAL